MMSKATIRQTAGKAAAGLLPPEGWQFYVLLRRGQRGPRLINEKVTDADLLDTLCELWRDECLRNGRPDTAFEEVSFRLRPQFLEAGSRLCDGFLLKAETPFGTSAERRFGKDAFTDVALRAWGQLINDKALTLEDEVWFEVEAAHCTPTARTDDLLSVENRSCPLTYLTISLPRLLKQTHRVGMTDGVFPVFYTEEALAKAEQVARRGADFNPPVETGGVQIGTLCSCPETGEFFPVVCDVLEVHDAEEGEFSLSYTGKSWARIQSIVRAMQSQPETRTLRMLGNTHGHNYMPVGEATCDVCRTQKECPRRNDNASLDDRVWGQAVFNRQPLHLCHIFGSNARKENVNNLYTLRGNRYQARGFHVIPHFSLPEPGQPTSRRSN